MRVNVHFFFFFSFPAALGVVFNVGLICVAAKTLKILKVLYENNPLISPLSAKGPGHLTVFLCSHKVKPVVCSFMECRWSQQLFVTNRSLSNVLFFLSHYSDFWREG